MSLWKIIIGAVIALIVAVPLVGYVALHYIGGDQIRPFLEQTVKKSTGRELTINGDVDVNISLTPSLSLYDITLSQPDWLDDSAMVSINRLDVQLDIRALLQRVLVVDELLIDGAVVTLVKDDARNNWTFAKQEQDASLALSGNDAVADKAKKPISLNVRHVSVKDTELVYQDGKTTQTVTVAALDMHMDDTLKITSNLDYRGMDIMASASSDATEIDMIATLPLSLDVSATQEGVDISTKGTLSSLTDTPSFDGLLDVAIASLARLNNVVPGGALSASPAITMNAPIKASASNIALTLDNARYGEVRISGPIAVALSKAKPMVTGDIAVPSYALASKVASNDEAADGAPPSTASDSNKPLPLDGLKAANANVKFTLGALTRGGQTLAKNVTMRAVLNNGRLQLNHLSLNSLGASVAGNIVVNAASSPASYALNLTGDNIVLETFLSQLASISAVEKGALNTKIALRSSGNTVDAIMAKLNGNVQYVLAETRYKPSAKIQKIGSFVQALRGKSSGGTIPLHCSVGDIKFVNGTARSNGIVIDTEGALVDVTGDIALSKRSLNLLLAPRPKQVGLSTLPVPIRVRGNMSSPSVALDTKGAVSTLSKVGFSLLKDKHDLSGLLGKDLAAQLARSDLSSSCLTDMPASVTEQLTTKEGLKKLEDDTKEELKDIERNIRGIRDDVKGLRDLF